MPVVSPIGYAAKERSIRENLMRKGMKSDERQPFPKLFFRNDFQHSLQESEAGQWLTPLKMVQLAPSATNKQPWRLVVEENKVHFYEEKTKGYANESSGDIQKVDLGIALYHFEVGAKEQGLKGSILQKNPGISTAENVEYIATYQLEDEDGYKIFFSNSFPDYDIRVGNAGEFGADREQRGNQCQLY